MRRDWLWATEELLAGRKVRLCWWQRGRHLELKDGRAIDVMRGMATPFEASKSDITCEHWVAV